MVIFSPSLTISSLYFCLICILFKSPCFVLKSNSLPNFFDSGIGLNIPVLDFNDESLVSAFFLDNKITIIATIAIIKQMINPNIIPFKTLPFLVELYVESFLNSSSFAFILGESLTFITPL